MQFVRKTFQSEACSDGESLCITEYELNGGNHLYKRFGLDTGILDSHFGIEKLVSADDFSNPGSTFLSGQQ